MPPVRAENRGDFVLRSIREIRQLKATALQRPHDVHIRAVITYYDVAGPNLFIQDSTAGIWVDVRGMAGIAPRPGQLVDLEGQSGVGFSPYINHSKWRVIGSSPPPKPLKLSYEKAQSGAFDSQWVEMEGVVRSFVQQAEGDVLVMDVATPTGSFKVRVPGYHQPFPMHLVDAKLRFHGVCGAAFNRRNQLVGIHIFMPSLADSEILEAAPKDPFNVPSTAIGEVGKFSHDLSDVRRIKVVGTATALFPARGLFVMDSSGGLYAESQDGSPAQPGDEVEVIGFPALGAYSPVLKSASFRSTGRHDAISPELVSGHQALQGRYDAQLVHIRGTVRGYRQNLRVYTPLVESDDHVVFETNLAGQRAGEWLGSTGTRVQLTGVCSVRADENGNPADFQIVLRTPLDVTVLASAPWLTSRRAFSLLWGLSILIVVVAVWVVILRRRVRQQTQLIQRKLEKEADLEKRYRRIFEGNLTGIFLAQKNGTIVDCNDSCARILGFSSRDDLLQNQEDAHRIVKTFCAPADSAGNAMTIVNAEHRLQRRDGTWAWILGNARTVEQTKGVEKIIEASLIDITDRKNAEEKIQLLAYYDSLTGLPNRTLLQDRLAKALASAKRHKEKLGVLFIDLDSFKIINDSLGHSCGDLLLQDVAVRLRTWAREQDTIARLGGDEFIIVLSSIKEAADAAVAAERISSAITREFVVQSHALNVTCSIGISIYPDHGEDAETLIKHADAAMYYSKESGRNKFHFFTSSMNAEVLERLNLENSLHTAVENGELFLMYQPEYNISTKTITTLEALVRWKHPMYGVIPPDKFIRIAENTGLILRIGEWVLKTACARTKEWEQNLGMPINIAVNVSAVQFRQENFCHTVRKVLAETGLDPHHLELELTETVLFSNEELMFQVLEELQQLGVRLAIDDFGTGYSNLNYLKQLPVSKLKIDRTFTQDLLPGSHDSAITAAIITMAKFLNLKVTAEGVETDEQLSVLHKYSCDEAQGFLLSKPLPETEISKVLEALKTT